MELKIMLASTDHAMILGTDCLAKSGAVRRIIETLAELSIWQCRTAMEAWRESWAPVRAPITPRATGFFPPLENQANKPGSSNVCLKQLFGPYRPGSAFRADTTDSLLQAAAILAANEIFLRFGV